MSERYDIPAVFACYNKNARIRDKSSSGGVFYLIARHVITEGGVVFGAKFNDAWEVEHDYTESFDGIIPFMGSKYVESFIGDTYRKAKEFLDKGRLVLYSGTPCQISGLKSFLKKQYDNLITVDFICHGVPSRMVWRKYIETVSSKHKIRAINFRDKSYGWRKFSLCFEFADGKYYKKTKNKDLYIKGFLQNLYLRPSCYECQFKGLDRKSDITLADFWGVQDLMPDMFDDKGTSVVLIHTESGKKILEGFEQELVLKRSSAGIVLKSNSAAVKSCRKNDKRQQFFEKSSGDILSDINDYTKQSLWKRIRYKLGKFKKK